MPKIGNCGDSAAVIDLEEVDTEDDDCSETVTLNTFTGSGGSMGFRWLIDPRGHEWIDNLNDDDDDYDDDDDSSIKGDTLSSVGYNWHECALFTVTRRSNSRS